MQIGQIGFGLSSIKRRAHADYDNRREIFRVIRQESQALSTGDEGIGKAGFLHCFAYFKTADQLGVGVQSGDASPRVQKNGSEVEPHISQTDDQDIGFGTSSGRCVHFNPHPQSMALETRAVRQSIGHCADIVSGKAWMQRQSKVPATIVY